MTEGFKGPPPLPREPDEHWLDRFVLPYITDSSLWPVLFAILGHVGVVLAMPMLNVYRSGDLVSLGALILLGVGPCGAILRWEWGETGKLGPLTRVVGLTWAMAFLLAYVANRYGLY